MSMPGFAGKTLYIDLSREKTETVPIDSALIKKYLGGAGIMNKLAEEIDPHVDPLSSDNSIIMGTGPLTGTIIPGSSELMVLYKSPLNGGFPYNCGGGKFAAFLKSNGYDHIVIKGKLKSPKYLFIQNDAANLVDAGDLWGKDSFETTDILRTRHEPCSIISLPPAGENLAAVSVTHIDKGGTVGSGGLAAVMGSKNLKAIVAAMGEKGIAVAHPRKLKVLVDEILSRVYDYHLRKDLLDAGSMAMTANWVPAGIMIKHSSVLIPYPENAKKMLSNIFELHKKSRKKIACISCPMSDKDRIDLSNNASIYDTAIMAERAIMPSCNLFGDSSSLSPDMIYEKALNYYDLLNRLGLDRTYMFEGLCDFVISLFEDGIITKQNTGIELDRSLDTLIKLARLIAFRDGFGDVLADGPIAAAQKIGKDSIKFLQNVIKGQFVAFDPRLSGFGSMQFASLTFPGRCFAISGAMGAPTYSPGWDMPSFIKQAKRCGVPEEAFNRVFSKDSFNPARLARHAEDFYCLFNMLGLCHRLYISRFYSVDIMAELYSAVTGIEVNSTDLKASAELVWKDWRMLNCNSGFERKDDEPPDVWFTPLKVENQELHLMDYFHTRKLYKKDIEKYLDDYYDERNWDKEKGIPVK